MTDNICLPVECETTKSDFLDNLNLLGPFGHMNQNPFFLIHDLRIINPVIIKLCLFNIFLSFFKFIKKYLHKILLTIFTL